MAHRTMRPWRWEPTAHIIVLFPAPTGPSSTMFAMLCGIGGWYWRP